MSDKAGLRVLVGSKAGFHQLAFIVIIVVLFVIGLTIPVIATFDAEMVVGAAGEVALPGIGLQDALSQFNAGRYACAFHFPDRNFLKFIDIAQMVTLLALDCRREQR